MRTRKPTVPFLPEASPGKTWSGPPRVLLAACLFVGLLLLSQCQPTAEEMARQGRELFNSSPYGCAACHGKNGQWEQSKIAPSLQSSDLRRGSLKGGESREAISRTILKGSPALKNAGMIAFEAQGMTENEARALAFFILSLRQDSPAND